MGSLVASPRVVKGLYGTRRGAGPYGLTHRRLGGEGLLWVPPDGGTLWRALGPPSATKASYGAGPGGPSPWGRRPRGGPFCTDSRFRSLFGWGGPIGSHSGGLPEGLVSWGLGGRVTAGNMEKLSSPGRGSGRRPPPIFSPPPHMFGRLSHRGGGGRRPVAEGQGQAQGKGQDAEGKRPPGGAPRTLTSGKGPPPSTCSGAGADARPSSILPGEPSARGGVGGGATFFPPSPLKARAAGARASPTSRRTDARSASSSTRASAMAAAGTFTRAWCATAATRSPSAPAARSRRPRPRGRDPTRQPVGARPPPLRALRRVAP
jgi:hypothetical protein